MDRVEGRRTGSKFVLSQVSKTRSFDFAQDRLWGTFGPCWTQESMIGVRATLKTDICKNRTPSQFAPFIMVFAVSAVGVIWTNREDVRAIAWHCTHGNYAEVAGHRVKLPLLWWKNDEDAPYRTVLLVRACVSCGVVQPELQARPLLPGQAWSSDEDNLKAMQKMVKERGGPFSDQARRSLVTLRSPAYVFYCKKEESTSRIADLPDNELFCEAANLPFSFLFDGHSFDDHAKFEREASQFSRPCNEFFAVVGERGPIFYTAFREKSLKCA
jgi:hypothetical protein